jgi:hypothetical protein
MGQSPRRRRLVVATTAVLLAGFVLSACASDAMHTPLIPPPPTDPKETASATAGLPNNYRELMAAYILSHNRYVIRDARITPPYEKSRGLFSGGTNPPYGLGRTPGDPRHGRTLEESEPKATNLSIPAAEIAPSASATPIASRHLVHDPEKWIPVFRKDHAPTKN